MKLIIFIFFTFIFISCDKILDTKPDDKITTPETIRDLWALLDNTDKMNFKCPIFDEVSADNYFLTSANFSRLKEEARDAYIWRLNNHNYLNEIARSSEAIYISNLCLETIEKLGSGNNQEFNEVKGTALFFRSFYWLRDLWTYSLTYDQLTASQMPGVILRLSSDFNIKAKRTNIQDSYNLLTTSLKQAVQLLPKNTKYPTRPSKAAAYALLARTYLSMNKFEEALLYADSCLIIKNDLMDFNQIPIEDTYPFESFNKEVIFHSSVNSYAFFNISPAYAYIDTLLYSTYHQNDLRKIAYFKPIGDYHQFKGSYWNNSSNVLFTGLAVDEVLLIKSECLARLNKIKEAADTFWILMKTRMNSKISHTFFEFKNKDEALETILLERRKELLFRGTRWSDIKRLNSSGEDISLKRILDNDIFILESNSLRFALPYPRDLIELTGIEQNKGW